MATLRCKTSPFILVRWLPIDRWCELRRAYSTCLATCILHHVSYKRSSFLPAYFSSAFCEERQNLYPKQEHHGIQPTSQPTSSLSYVWGFIYTPIPDPCATKLALEDLYQSFDANGRVYLSEQGINVQLCLPTKNVELLRQRMLGIHDGIFKNMHLYDALAAPSAISSASSPPDGAPQLFEKLSVRIRPQLGDGLHREYSKQLDSIIPTLKHLSPAEWHTKLASAVRTHPPRRVYAPEGYTFQPPVPVTSTFSHSSQSSSDNAATFPLPSSSPSSTATTTTITNPLTMEPPPVESCIISSEHKGDAPPIILDVRNGYEYEIGSFIGATPLLVDTYRESFAEVDRLFGLSPRCESLPTFLTNTSVSKGPSLDPKTNEDNQVQPNRDNCLQPVQARDTHGVVAPVPPTVSQEAERLIPTPSQPLDRSREVMIYCTGGIRCLKMGAYLKDRGYENVSVLEGGINAYIRYVEQLRGDAVEEPLQPSRIQDNFNEKANEGSDNMKGAPSQLPGEAMLTQQTVHLSRDVPKVSLFQGVNFMFDQRLAIRGSNDIVSHCHLCGDPSDAVGNCAHPPCGVLMIACDACRTAYHECCSVECAKAISGSPQFHLDPAKLVRSGNRIASIREKPPQSTTVDRVRPRLVPLTRAIEPLS